MEVVLNVYGNQGRVRPILVSCVGPVRINISSRPCRMLPKINGLRLRACTVIQLFHYIPPIAQLWQYEWPSSFSLGRVKLSKI